MNWKQASAPTSRVSSTSFVRCSGTVLEMILRSDELNCSEMRLFAATLRWAVAACGRMNLDASAKNMRAQLGGCFNLIRFPLMSSIDLLSCYENYPNLLEHKKYCDIMQYIMNKRPLTHAKQFSVVSRMSFDISFRLLDIDDPLNLNTIESRVDMKPTVFTIKIKGSNVALTCYDIVLPKNILVAPSCMLVIKVGQLELSHVLDLKPVKLVKTQSNKIFQVWRYHLENPFLLETGKQYVIVIESRHSMNMNNTIEFPSVSYTNESNCGLEIHCKSNVLVSELYFNNKP